MRVSRQGEEASPRRKPWEVSEHNYFPAQKWILQKRVSSERLPRTAKSPAG